MRWFRQLYALLWKNAIIKRRAWVTTLMEILLPVLVMILMLGIRSSVSKQNQPPTDHLKDMCPRYFNNMDYCDYTMYSPSPQIPANWFDDGNKHSNIAFAPSPGIADDIRAAFISQYPQLANRTQAFASNEELENYCTDVMYGVPGANRPYLLVGIVMNSIGTRSHPQWSYTLRLNGTTNVPTTPDPNQVPAVNTQHNTYDASWDQILEFKGHIFLQNFVENYILMKTTNITSMNRAFSTAPFPTPHYIYDGFFAAISTFLGFFFTLVYIWPVTRLVKGIVEEKETRIKEGMKMMGLSESVLWLSWVITYAIIFLITAILLMLVTMGSIFPHSDRGRIFSFFWMFSLTVISFCYFISVFFSRATIASTIGAVIFLVSFFPYYAVNSSTTSSSSKMLASLSPPIAFALGSGVIANWETSETGVNNLNSSVDIDNFSYDRCIAMLVVDFVLYTLLSVYLSRVVRSEWGTSLPFYYPCTRSFWCPAEMKKPDPSRAPAAFDGAAVHHVELKEKEDNEYFEPVSLELKRYAAVIIRHLRKVFSVDAQEPQVAVKDLNLDLYSGQILALLGHNGAGKTTTINMLTGMLPPTSGDANIFNRSIVNDMDAIRTILGVCPQHNILFPELTVEEHLKLFCHIKAVDWVQVDTCVKEMIEQVGLVEKTHYRSGALSGGMQRKLSVGIALIGDSKIVFLDEPTSGMDPYSRRATWDLLKRKKEGRVIILTTHFMDEADQLGDRIAIMAKGEIKCCGSSLFLKSRYGVGYTMTITKRANFSSLEVPRLVRAHISDAEQLSNVAGEISFRLPMNASKHFALLFEEFDAKQDELGIDSYGISVTTLEEVFLRVGRNEETNEAIRASTKAELIRQRSRSISYKSIKQEESLRAIEVINEHNSNHVSVHPEEPHIALNVSNTTMDANQKPQTHNKNDDDDMDTLGTLKQNENPQEMFIRHFRALMIKRWSHFKRDRKSWAWTIVYPVILLLFIGVLKLALPSRPDVLISINQFNQPAPTPIGFFTDSTTPGTPVLPVNDVSRIPSMSSINLYEVPPSQLNTFTASNFSDVLTSYMKNDDSQYIAIDVNKSSIFKSQFYAAWQMNQYLFTTMLNQQDQIDTRDPNMKLTRYIALMANINIDANNNTLNDQYVIMWNSTAIYGVSVGMNLYNQYLLQYLTQNPLASIELHSHSFPDTAEQKTLINNIAGIFIAVAFAFIPASFVGYSVREEADKVKHQQLISGVSTLAYWSSQYAWDFCNFLIPGFLSLIIYQIYGIDNLIGSNSGASILLIILYGLAVIPFSYCCSFLFTNAVSAQNIMLIVLLLSGALLSIVSGILDFLGGSTQSTNHELKFLFRILPPYCFAETIGNMLSRSTIILWGTPRTTWDMDITGYNMIYLLWQTFLFSMMVLIIEKVRATPEILHKLFPSAEASYREFPDEDPDVIREKERLMKEPIPTSNAHNRDIISIRGLRKVYEARKGQDPKIAVHDLWLRIPEGQCFGYLGINGAGKTTTLKMLTADILPSAGTAYLNGLDIQTQQASIRRLLGYCPQFDALIDSLTAREHLYLFARIKGVDEDKIPRYVNKLIEKIGLQDGIADKPSAGYSGGNKRKLCVGIALIGNPPIVFLDEPSTGMDPGSRRFMWDLIGRTMAGRSVILTTHSMEECEALCQNIGIMVGGRLRCIGSAQHLKSVHGSGFQVDAHIGSSRQSSDFREFMMLHFEGCKLIEEHGENVKYRVSKENHESRVTIASLFRLLEANKEKYGITDYSVSETTLEQIFIHFARQQEEETGHIAGIQ